eukprot:scaffold21117_cov77-Phaeocystis_antarctica.AAC.1
MPTYPEDRSRALKVYQEHQQVGQIAHQAPAFEIEGTIISRLRRPIRAEPSRSHSARRALCDHEGGEWRHKDTQQAARLLRDSSTATQQCANNAQTRYDPYDGWYPQDTAGVLRYIRTPRYPQDTVSPGCPPCPRTPTRVYRRGDVRCACEISAS